MSLFGVLKRFGIAPGVVVMLTCAMVANAQVDWTWINAAGGYWTDGAKWNKSGGDGTYPGDDADNPDDRVYLTGALSSYAVILDQNLVDSIGTLTISNAAGNTATLVVTNSTLGNDALALRNGGRLRIDNGGTVQSSTLSWRGTSGVIEINDGGELGLTWGLTLGAANVGGETGVLTGTVGLGGTLSAQGLVVGPDAAGSSNNQLTVSGGVTFTNTGSGRLYVGCGEWNHWDTYNNSLVVSGANTRVLLNGCITRLGLVNWNTQTAVSNRIVIADGAVLDQTGGGGGVVEFGVAGDNGGTSSWNRVEVNDGALILGGNAVIGYAKIAGSRAAYNRLTATNGAMVTVVGVTVGVNVGALGNSLVVGGGATVRVTGGWPGLDVGHWNGTPGSNNHALVTGGGILEANNLLVNGAANGNMITNNGGIYQFTTATPTIAASGVSLQDGTVSFRAIDNADVGCISGSLKNIVFGGTNNTFMLNNATNLAAGQAYTFQQSGSPSNFVNLAFRGSSRYRGGDVTIADGGGLESDLESTLTVDGAMSITGTTTIRVSGTLESGEHVLVTAAGGISGRFAVKELPDKCGIRYRGNSIVIVRKTGTVVFMR